MSSTTEMILDRLRDIERRLEALENIHVEARTDGLIPREIKAEPVDEIREFLDNDEDDWEEGFDNE